jgi:hypothetical protein
VTRPDPADIDQERLDAFEVKANYAETGASLMMYSELRWIFGVVVALRAELADERRAHAIAVQEGIDVASDLDRERAAREAAERERDELLDERWRYVQAVEAAGIEVARLRELAKNARAVAAAPDYDEQAIKDALWAVADAALASGQPADTTENTA